MTASSDTTAKRAPSSPVSNSSTTEISLVATVRLRDHGWSMHREAAEDAGSATVAFVAYTLAAQCVDAGSSDAPTPSPARGRANAPNRAVKQYLAERRPSRPNRSPCVADRRLNRDLCRREGQARPLSGTRTAPPLPIRAPAVSGLPSVNRGRLDEIRDHAVSPRVKRRRGWWTAAGRLSVCRVHPGRRRTNPRARHVPPQALPTLLEIYWREGRRPPAQYLPTRVARPSLRRPPPRAPAAPHQRFALVDPQPCFQPRWPHPWPTLAPEVNVPVNSRGAKTVP